MIKIYLLQGYEGKFPGSIINVTKKIAEMLIDGSVGRYATNRDFLIKPQFGTSKAFKTNIK